MTTTAYERLTHLSAQALAAVEASDVEELARLMDERSNVISHLHATEGEGLLSPPERQVLLSAARTLERADHRLALALASKRDEVARGLADLEKRQPGRSAYGRPRSSGGRHINIIR